ncbi:enoyl-CoA hydratase/isomerase family protein [Hyaloraphidium curvatum]|nr:enoyl-CoA hydratase/isomerase family protein [Hyaloraphidium curvatum]
MDYSGFSDIKVDVDRAKRVAVLTINRPQAMNSWTTLMALEFMKAFNMFNQDPDVKVVVVTGAGDRAFCAGADLSGGSFGGGERVEEGYRDSGGQAALAVARCSKVVIAAVNGSAVGVGMTITLPMDFRIVSDTAKVGFVFARRGIAPEAASSWFLPQLIGRSRTLNLFLSGKVYQSTDPLFSELFYKVVPQKQVLAEALDLAHEIARENSEISMAMIKGLIWHPAESPEGQHLLDSRVGFFVSSERDSKEGVTSFLEKRPPNFPMRVSNPADLPNWYPWWKHTSVAGRGWPEHVDSVEDCDRAIADLKKAIAEMQKKRAEMAKSKI